MNILKVASIAGEWFDLESGQSEGKSIKITNGIRSYDIPVSDDDVKALLQLYTEGLEERVTREMPNSFDDKEKRPEQDEAPYSGPSLVDDLTGVMSA
jgi:hypothetical protein